MRRRSTSIVHGLVGIALVLSLAFGLQLTLTKLGWSTEQRAAASQR